MVAVDPGLPIRQRVAPVSPSWVGSDPRNWTGRTGGGGPPGLGVVSGANRLVPWRSTPVRFPGWLREQPAAPRVAVRAPSASTRMSFIPASVGRTRVGGQPTTGLGPDVCRTRVPGRGSQGGMRHVFLVTAHDLAGFQLT